MQISTTYSSTSLSLASQSLEASVSASARPTQVSAPKDRVEVSDEALQSSRKVAGHSAESADTTLQMLGDLLNQITGSTVEQLSYQETALTAESASLSFSGSIATKDGKEVSFGLELQYEHASFAAQSASFQAGPEGLSLSFEGSAAELSSTSFSFMLSATGDNAPITGKGAFHLNDEVSKIGKELKPVVKEFMEATGARGGWGQVNRFLRSIG